MLSRIAIKVLLVQCLAIACLVAGCELSEQELQLLDEAEEAFDEDLETNDESETVEGSFEGPVEHWEDNSSEEDIEEDTDSELSILLVPHKEYRSLTTGWSMPDAWVYEYETEGHLFRYLGNYPSDDEASHLFKELNGVTSDGENWYFSNNRYKTKEAENSILWKMPMSDDLETVAPGDILWPSISTLHGEFFLANIANCNHYGDIDYYEHYDGRGYLVVPLEGCYGGDVSYNAIFRAMFSKQSPADVVHFLHNTSSCFAPKRKRAKHN